MAGEETESISQSTVSLLVESVRQVNEKLERIDHMLRGNGKVGMLTDVALIESRVKQLERMAREYAAMKRWLMASLFTFAGTVAWNVVSWAMSMGAAS
jgi:hypothetical protein